MDSPQYVIHFLQLTQKQLNELLKVTHQLKIDCCYLGHQEVEEKDLLIISSSIKLSELKKIREKYSNGIFLVLDKALNGSEINQFNEIGNIHFVDKIKHEFLSRVEILRSMRNREKDNIQTLAIISHDLKNPLNAIRLDAQILHKKSKRSDLSREEIKRFANRIIKTTDRLALMVNDLLDRDKQGNVLISLTRTFVNAESLIDEVIDVVRPIAKRNSLKIKKNIHGEIPEFLADKNKIFQVLLNLMSNALKFSYQHTIVQLEVRLEKKCVYFSVLDSGPGIDPVMDSVLYEKYCAGQGKESGSGLGLYICKTIVEAHQGVLTHHKREKGGTCFEFYLPLAMEKRDSNLRKIYLIDDDEDLRDVLSWALNSEGYHVESFANPQLALKSLENGLDRPALIMTDFDNEEILKFQNIPLLLTVTSPESIGEYDNRRYSEILYKPLDLDNLVNKVSHYMNL
ncbi:MAG: ATP-binding protein [Bacteriovoracaceae bacterium]